MNTEVITMNKYDIQRVRVKNLKRTYPPGTRIELISMSDPYAPVSSGTKGTVFLTEQNHMIMLILQAMNGIRVTNILYREQELYTGSQHPEHITHL